MLAVGGRRCPGPSYCLHGGLQHCCCRVGFGQVELGGVEVRRFINTELHMYYSLHVVGDLVNARHLSDTSKLEARVQSVEQYIETAREYQGPLGILVERTA
jgi:hypothetical protein